jgi:hypothetical protein
VFLVVHPVLAMVNVIAKRVLVFVLQGTMALAVA